MECEIVKRNGIVDIFSGYSPGKVEEEKSILSRGSIVSELMSEFHSFLKGLEHESYDPLFPNSSYGPKPNLIEAFQISSAIFNDHRCYSVGLARYLNSIIQNSYDQGNNCFNIISEAALGYLGYMMQGKKGSPLHLKIQGNCRHGCGYLMRKGIIEVFGDVGSYIMPEAEDVVGIFHGDILGAVGRSARRCTYKTTNKKTLDTLLKMRKWRVYFIHPNGEEEIIGDRKR